MSPSATYTTKVVYSHRLVNRRSGSMICFPSPWDTGLIAKTRWHRCMNNASVPCFKRLEQTRRGHPRQPQWGCGGQACEATA
nr:MAG TPA: hypothetical protein [Caudoviricetes sp.]